MDGDDGKRVNERSADAEDVFACGTARGAAHGAGAGQCRRRPQDASAKKATLPAALGLTPPGSRTTSVVLCPTLHVGREHRLRSKGV